MRSAGSGAQQAALPRGLAGRLTGRIMALLNADMERRAVDQLSLGAGARLLAIGFGSGVGVRYALDHLADARVAGVDPSREMLAQARRRTKRAGKDTDLRLGTATQLPWPDRTFDAAVTVNNIQLWRLPNDLDEVRRVLGAHGLLSVAVHTAMLADHLACPRADAGARLNTMLSRTGFDVAQSEITRARTGSAIYLTAVAA